MIATIADGIVTAVKVGHRRRAWLSAAALLLTFMVATAYLLVGALRVNPVAKTYQVTIEQPESAGLLPKQDVGALPQPFRPWRRCAGASPASVLTVWCLNKLPRLRRLP